MWRKLKIIFITLLILILAGFAINWILILRKAHSTFEDYYKFRGCVELVQRTPDYGTCKLSNGQIIKIVKFQQKWYLDGDLPHCWFFGMCI